MDERRTTCAHGDPFCPCQDGDACHYEDIEVDGHISPASPCRNPLCGVCK